jgi:thioesterase domain-containing protein
MIPSVWVFLDALPQTPSGKVDRRALPAPERERPELERGYVAPRGELEAAMAGLWGQVLGLEKVGAEDDFFALGGTSLQGALLINLIAERLGVAVPVAALFEAPTVAALAKRAGERAGEAGARSPLVAIEPRGEGRPFFCVHPVGGNVLCYADLARRLGAERPFYGLEAVGLAGGEPQRRVEEMAATYVQAILAVQPEGPYLLGGWSVGGLVAYEMARQLSRRGRETALLALIDSPPPGRIAGGPAAPPDDAEVLSALARDLGGLAGRELPVDPEALRRAPPAERLDLLLREATGAGALPAGLGSGQVRRLVEVFQANLEAAAAYAPGPAGGSPPRAILYQTAERPEQAAGWRELLGGGLDVEALAGDHYSLLREPTVAHLAERLRARFAGAWKP